MDEYLRATRLVDLDAPVVRERRDPAVRKYLDLEFPHTPPSLQAIIAMCLLDMDYEDGGQWLPSERENSPEVLGGRYE